MTDKTAKQQFTEWMETAGTNASIAVEAHGGMTEDGKHEVYVHLEHEGIMLTLDGVLELKWDAQAEADWLAERDADCFAR